ncbi:hypothetical protein CVT25_002456 [Psilocybe cyanescens]|uniref:Uncharacterized protein n=1 Tax=Psilocybe cyanescens TaxID=93625 RepID=A0A409X6G1_PSICY|nr:hypothetical protein CVT25_002456 [Psilocybe cyanescens]
MPQPPEPAHPLRILPRHARPVRELVLVLACVLPPDECQHQEVGEQRGDRVEQGESGVREALQHEHLKRCVCGVQRGEECDDVSVQETPVHVQLEVRHALRCARASTSTARGGKEPDELCQITRIGVV